MNRLKKILVTGAKGFIGKNLVAELRNRKDYEILEFDKDNSSVDLGSFAKECDLVFHFAGVNRPQSENEFTEGNLDFTKMLLNNLKQFSNKAPIIFSSSTQVAFDNPYGKSKQAAEATLANYSKEMNVPVLIYRFPNVFGKWCRPSYNSVVATFCHNIANNLPIQINDPTTILNLIYIDDVIDEFINLTQNPYSFSGCTLKEKISPLYTLSLYQLATLLESFRKTRDNRTIPDVSDPFTQKLYATYLSYLPANGFAYPLKMNTDNRGSFTEFIRSSDRGQVSVSISKPGIVKGNHWHHTKNEKFLVVNGIGLIRFRKIGTADIIEYHVSGEKLEVVDIPPGYTHNIENLGKTDMVTVMWASEPFDPEKPDTFFEEV
jgi:UDP-2-acetamido-2,6-beta-L-arabino-hexul-4-ose reductase